MQTELDLVPTEKNIIASRNTLHAELTKTDDLIALDNALNTLKGTPGDAIEKYRAAEITALSMEIKAATALLTKDIKTLKPSEIMALLPIAETTTNESMNRAKQNAATFSGLNTEKSALVDAAMDARADTALTITKLTEQKIT
ncbi:MAG: hypothetical protein NTU49_04475, partial [Gammaproteobacteria bacterium]|nr:hypothetical protein [Gammaproteobacteria bacterium]